jgi:serine/threonine-protein kinase
MDLLFNNLGIMIGETYRTEKPSRIIRTDKAIRYMRQTLEGLAALHHAGIIHRDIKPFNIMVTEQDDVKISDFGLSKLRGETFDGPPNLKVGSPWYAAPEQETDPDAVDFSADLYSVGITFYRMLTGILPEKRMLAPSNLNPDLNPRWDLFFKKATAPERQQRFARAQDMLAQLKALEAEWNETQAETCQLVPAYTAGLSRKKDPFKSTLLRGKPLKLTSRQAKIEFSVDDLWRPRDYIRNDFVIRSAGILTDRATDLLWQQSGSDYPLTWHQAQEYISQLNQIRLGDKDTWRLPTVNELMSLLTPTPHGEDYCIEPIFNRTQKWLWSSDRRSFTAAWYVSIDLGFVSWQDFSGHYYVRGVSSN